MNELPNILDKIPELEPDIPAESLAGSTLLQYLLWGGAAAAVLLALGIWLLVRWLRRRAQKTTPPPSPAEIACAALARVEEDMPPLRECSLRISMIMRTFLQGQTQDTSLYETHEEFSRRMDSLSGVPAACQNAMRDLLEDLVRYKYAGDTAHDGFVVKELTERGRALVQHITEEQLRESAARQKEEVRA